MTEKAQKNNSECLGDFFVFHLRIKSMQSLFTKRNLIRGSVRLLTIGRLLKNGLIEVAIR